jgi:flagellar hook assembly protein FlgD
MLPPAPNPFRASTSIGFHLERPGRVAGEIYDLHGRLVTRFEERVYAVGRGRFTWDGRTESGVPLDSGVYFYRLRLDGRTAGTGRVMLMR